MLTIPGITKVKYPLKNVVALNVFKVGCQELKNNEGSIGVVLGARLGHLVPHVIVTKCHLGL